MIINSATVDLKALPPAHREWVYNNLDCCITHEVKSVIEQHLDVKTQRVYNFERALQGPALQMMMRGIAVDPAVRSQAITKYALDGERVNAIFQAECEAITGSPLNPRSTKQLKALFYEHLHCPPIYRFTKGKRRLTTDRDALDILEAYFYAQPFVVCIKALRDIDKKLQTLRVGIERGRIYTSYNVGATETGRWSSSKNVRGKGMSFHTVTDELRRMLIPDLGNKLGYLDLEQAESQAVAFRCNDHNYIMAHATGDLHTTVAKMIWPDKDPHAIAYRHFTYRDLAKRCGHATNYGATPYTLAKTLKIELGLAEEFQRLYFIRFPGIKDWHHRIARQLTTKGYMVTFMGRRRTFFGRLDDDATLREAIAYEPQSVVADILNLGLFRVWRDLDPKSLTLCGQVHDAILVQYKNYAENVVIPKALQLMEIPVKVGKREMLIEVDAAVGYNWAKADPKHKIFADGNPGGLASWRDVKRGKVKQKAPKKIPLLDQRISAIYAKHRGSGDIL